MKSPLSHFPSCLYAHLIRSSQLLRCIIFTSILKHLSNRTFFLSKIRQLQNECRILATLRFHNQIKRQIKHYYQHPPSIRHSLAKLRHRCFRRTSEQTKTTIMSIFFMTNSSSRINLHHIETSICNWESERWFPSRTGSKREKTSARFLKTTDEQSWTENGTGHVAQVSATMPCVRPGRNSASYWRLSAARRTEEEGGGGEEEQREGREGKGRMGAVEGEGRGTNERKRFGDEEGWRKEEGMGKKEGGKGWEESKSG